MSAPTILVVDYEPNNLQKVKSLLEANSYAVETATDGLMAIKRFEEVGPKLVLLSAMLPKLHGFEACQKIKASSNGEAVPVIIMTSIYKGRKYRHDALTKYGASEYLEKPFDDETLLGHIRELLVPGAVRTRAAAIHQEMGGGASHAEGDEDVPDLEDDDDIPELLDEEDDGERTMLVAPPTHTAPGADALTIEEEVVEEVEEVEEVLGDDEQTMTVDPEVARRALAAVQEADRDEQRGLTAREIFSDVINEVEQEVGEPLKKIALQRAALGNSAGFMESRGAEAEPEPPEPEPVVELPPPPPSPPARTIRSGATAATSRARARTAELPSMASLVSETAPAKTEPSPNRSQQQDLFKQKLEETLTGLGIPVKRETKRKTQELPAPRPREAERAPERTPAPAVAPSRPEPGPAAPAPSVESGVQFGNYTLLEKIAAGGMAELFKAKMQGVEGFRKLVAIKRILPHLTDNDEFVHMFIDEAKLAAQLNHQNIAHIFDLGRIDKFYYIAMEYVAGRDLRAILKHAADNGDRFPVELAVLVASKVASALDYAHRKKDFDERDLNIVHRDISPQNVLISYEGEVKLVDFGIAKAVSRSSQTESGTVKGKLLYMSPEQARGAEIDKRSDIFSLGVVMYEMLTGEKLFMDETEMDIIRRVRDCRVSSPRRLNPAIPKELDLVVMTALEKRPEDRYQNAYKMQKDLENIMYAWESTPTSVNLAQYMAEEFGREGETADADQTMLAASAPVATAAPAPPSTPARRPEPPSPRPSPPPPSFDGLDDDETLMADDASALTPPPPPAPPRPSKSAKSAKPAKPSKRAPAAKSSARPPAVAPGMIMPDTGMIRVGKEEQVDALAGKQKSSGAPVLYVVIGLAGVAFLVIVIVASYLLLRGSTEEPAPAETPTVAATAATPAAPPTPDGTTGAATPTVEATPAATPSPTVAATPVAPEEIARQARIDDNLRALEANQKAADWEATLRSADRVLKDDGQNARALSAKSEAQAKIAAKKKEEEARRAEQEAERQRVEAERAEAAYAAAMESAQQAFDAGKLDKALASADEALKAKPRDGDARALRKKIVDRQKAEQPPATPKPDRTKPTPKSGTTPPEGTDAAAVDSDEVWLGKIRDGLAAPTIDVAALERLFVQAQTNGVGLDALKPLYAEFQSKKPKPEENTFVSLEQLDKRPELVSKVDANFTRQAELQKIQGTVLVQATIDASGEVVETKVTRGLGFGLDENAEKAVKKFRFTPPEKQGVKVKTTLTIPIVFQR